MPAYQKMYTTLFNAVSDAIERIGSGDYDGAKEILIQGQQKTEEFYITGDKPCHTLT